jgi:hypothetical protein
MKREDEKVLYTDGGTVTVTESALQVKKMWYDLRGVSKYGLIILQPSRLPWLIVMVAGIVLLIAGSMKLVPGGWLEDMYWGDVVVTENLLTTLVGALVTLASIGVMLTVTERYAVSITTAEGEQQVVVSKRKEYVACIIRALNNAFFARIQSKGDGKVREYTVSSR